MTFDRLLVCDDQAQKVARLSKEILGESFLVIDVVQIKFSESFELAFAKFEAKILEVSDNKARKHNIAGEGVGLLDACFDAMLKGYEPNYCSISSISIVDFNETAHIEHGNERKSDAKVTALLRVKNSEAHEYCFQCTTSSISHSSISVVQEAFSFFINAESAYVRLYRAWADAKERGRYDLIDRYRNQMSVLVQATSYEKLVARLKENPNI
jgi:hypothetical protein